MIGSRTGKLLAALVGSALALGLTSTAAASTHAEQPFYPIDKQRLEVPADVQPWLPTWTPDGSHIIFQNQLEGTTWVVGKNGKNPACITCGFADRPDIHGGFTYAFPGNRRLFVSHELGSLGGIDSGPDADAFVLECAPSIYDCATHSYLPVDMSADKPGAPLIVQRRTWHLAPDGEHLGWTDLRLDGMVMVVGRLEREADRYVVADQKAINPPGPRSLTDTDPTGWANNNQLYELKSFTDGGAAAIVVGGPHFNVDALKIDLKSGAVKRLTANHDWDEDGATSPDGDLYALYSWRTRHRLDALSWIPKLEPFVEMPMFAALAAHYVSTWQGFQCDLSPWLLSSSGDARGRLIGQPLNVYPASSNLTPGNNLSGQQFWSLDSRKVLLQERLRTQPPGGLSEHVEQKGLTPNRILIARIDRKPGKAERIVSSEVGSWAPPPNEYAGTTGSGASVTVTGHGGGTAEIAYSGNLSSGSWSASFHQYSRDGKTFVDGTYLVTSASSGSYWTINADLRVSGKHTGSLDAALVVNNGAEPLPAKSGTFTAAYDGKTAPPLPELGRCYGDLPHKSDLAIASRSKPGSGRDRVVVRVKANVYGDKRPVQRAVVRIGRQSVKTNHRGRAVLRIRGHGRRVVIAKAGDTFNRARGHVRLR
ncbi:MAG: hypothetical protein GEU88_00650 [Solirubrobacterales bacterium]|nr:hypothetical protein [Solirubrobacterales bacterium]